MYLSCLSLQNERTLSRVTTLIIIKHQTKFPFCVFHELDI